MLALFFGALFIGKGREGGREGGGKGRERESGWEGERVQNQPPQMKVLTQLAQTVPSHELV